jgi:hypothetical protein
VIGELALGIAGLAAVAAAAGAVYGTARIMQAMAQEVINTERVSSGVKLENSTLKLKAERLGFERDQTTAALEAANTKTKDLENALSRAQKDRPSLGDGLAPDDLAGRLRRIQAHHLPADAGTGGALSAFEPGEELPLDEPASDPGAGEVLPGERPDV